MSVSPCAELLLAALALFGVQETEGEPGWLGEWHRQFDNPAYQAGVQLEAGHYGAALEAAGRIEDPELSAEWRFHVLHSGGDLPGALDAAVRGLALAPHNPGLLENATRTALSLGLGDAAASHARVLAALPGLDAALAERAASLLSDAAALERLEARGQRGVRRARATAALLLAAALVGLALLARRSAG